MKGLLDPQRGRDPQVDNHCSMISPTVSSSCVVLLWLHHISPLCLVHDTASSESLSLPASGDTAGAHWGSQKTYKGIVHTIPTELPCLTVWHTCSCSCTAEASLMGQAQPRSCHGYLGPRDQGWRASRAHTALSSTQVVGKSLAPQ